MKKGWILLYGILLGLLASVFILIVGSPPRGKPILLSTPARPIPIQVHISGAIKNPGVYYLPYDSRLHDAVDTAGGFIEGVNIAPLNLVSYLNDGDRIVIPFLEEKTPVSTNDEEIDGYDSTTDVQLSDFPININTATIAELEQLDYIGPVKAQSIVDYRQGNGLFNTIEDIQKVNGIGPGTFEQIKSFIIVNNTP